MSNLFNASESRTSDRLNMEDERYTKDVSYDTELNTQILENLGDNSISIEDRINTFGNFCKEHIFIINAEQADYLINLLNSAKSIHNEPLINNYLHAIELVVSFREEFNNELFLEPHRLESIIDCFPHSYAFNIAGLLSSMNEYSAKIVFSYQSNHKFVSEINSDQSLLFLTTFIRYDSLQEEILPLIQEVISLAQDRDGKLRFECLRFIYFCVKESSKIQSMLVDYDDFYLIFQNPPEIAQTHDLMLLILREITFKSQNPKRTILDTNLIYFVFSALNSEDICTLSYAIDIIGDIAEFGLEDATQILLQNNVPQILLKIIEERPLQNVLCAVNSLIRIILNSPFEIQIQLFENDFIDILADNLTLMSFGEANSCLIVLNTIIKKADLNNQPAILEMIFSNENLYSALTDLLESDENVYAESILARFN